MPSRVWVFFTGATVSMAGPRQHREWCVKGPLTTKALDQKQATVGLLQRRDLITKHQFALHLIRATVGP